MDCFRLTFTVILFCWAGLAHGCDLSGASNCTIPERIEDRDRLCQYLKDYITCLNHHIAGCTEDQSHIFTEAIENLKSGYENVSFDCHFEHPDGDLALQGPKDVVGFLGSSVQVYCNVVRRMDKVDSTDTGVFTLQWQFKPLQSSTFHDILTVTGLYHMSWEVASADWSKYNITKGKQLSIHHVNFTDAGTYRCHLRDTGATAEAEVFVLGKAECENKRPIIQLVNVSHPPNALYTCGVKYSGSFAPNLTWFNRDDQLIEMEEKISQDSVSSVLSFPVTPLDKGKRFRCHISYQTADFVNLCQPSPPLNIKFPVRVTSLVVNPYTKSNYFHKGEKVTLYCGATGDPSPMFEWKFRRINSTQYRVLSHYHHHLIPDLEEDNAGEYQCIVNNNIQGQNFQDAKMVVIQLAELKNTDRQVRPDTGRLVHKATISPYAIGAMVSAALAVILIIVFIFLAVKLKKRERRIREKLARAHDETLDDQEVELLDEHIQPCRDDLPFQYGNLRQNWEVLKCDIRLMEMIGKGSFTEVYKGRMRRQPGEEGTMKVAIKKAAVEATDKEKKFFSSELEVMKMLQSHPNIVHLMGCYTKSEPHLMILEYAAEDTLLNYLQLHRPGKREVSVTISDKDSQAVRLHTKGLNPQKMIHLAAQIIHGLQHLTKFKLVSYRLRAAGILVVRGGICKLSGFGFPQDILERNIYEAASAPIRWMSPESLSQHVFDWRTDTWAFGVLLWEILHFGLTPYGDMGPHEVAEKVQAGYRLPQPSHCSNELYKLMLSCWTVSPDQPPSHDCILQGLEQIATCSTSHIRLEKMPDYLKWMAPIQEETSLDMNVEAKC